MFRIPGVLSQFLFNFGLEPVLYPEIRMGASGTFNATSVAKARLRFIVFSQASTGGAARSWVAPLFNLIWHKWCV